MSQPNHHDVNHHDVNLILRLYELRREEKMRAARLWFVVNFKCKTMEEFTQLCPPGSEANSNYRQFASYWEMAASFVNAGALDPDLFFINSREMLLCWIRLKPFIADVRTAYGDATYMAQLEKAGSAYAAWLTKNGGPDAYTNFVKRLG